MNQIHEFMQRMYKIEFIHIYRKDNYATDYLVSIRYEMSLGV
ncbi:hypothetical protein LINGRAHAP2_LOCUS33033 [Linum grandiflorum]